MKTLNFNIPCDKPNTYCIISLEGRNKTQGPNLDRASGSGNGSEFDHSPKDE
jgi:hypothetical protein